MFAIDVSRMARASEDWRRLLGLCGVAGVAVVDEQRIYDPNDQDDKLLLELKGTMSEAEIHWLRLRLRSCRAMARNRLQFRQSSLLDAPGRAGITLTESCAMLPTASVSGLLLAHPEAHYFAVGRLGKDQVADYARRKGMPLHEAERWLAPNLGYEADGGGGGAPQAAGPDTRS